MKEKMKKKIEVNRNKPLAIFRNVKKVKCLRERDGCLEGKEYLVVGMFLETFSDHSSGVQYLLINEYKQVVGTPICDYQIVEVEDNG